MSYAYVFWTKLGGPGWPLTECGIQSVCDMNTHCLHDMGIVVLAVGCAMQATLHDADAAVKKHMFALLLCCATGSKKTFLRAGEHNLHALMPRMALFGSSSNNLGTDWQAPHSGLGYGCLAARAVTP
jgi:hypothetical protein